MKYGVEFDGTPGNEAIIVTAQPDDWTPGEGEYVVPARTLARMGYLKELKQPGDTLPAFFPDGGIDYRVLASLRD